MSKETIDVGDENHSVIVEVEDCLMGPDCKCEDCKKETEFNNLWLDRI